MKLVSANDPVLKTKCEDFDFANPPFEPVEFAQNLVKSMYENNGLGLSANQIGISYRVFAMRGAPENYVCFNPRVIMPSEETILLEEGCLSYPNLYVKIWRPRHIRVRFNTPNGDTKTETFTGLSARCFLHEMDHMDGFEFYRHANSIHKAQAFARLKRYERSEKRANDSVLIQSKNARR